MNYDTGQRAAGHRHSAPCLSWSRWRSGWRSSARRRSDPLTVNELFPFRSHTPAAPERLTGDRSQWTSRTPLPCPCSKATLMVRATQNYPAADTASRQGCTRGGKTPCKAAIHPQRWGARGKAGAPGSRRRMACGGCGPLAPCTASMARRAAPFATRSPRCSLKVVGCACSPRCESRLADGVSRRLWSIMPAALAGRRRDEWCVLQDWARWIFQPRCRS